MVKNRTLNLLSGFASILDLWPSFDRNHEQHCRALEQLVEDRPSDYEMILFDMRRVMLRNLDMMSNHERQQPKEQLQSGTSFRFEQRLGLDEPKANGQLEFSLGE